MDPARAQEQMLHAKTFPFRLPGLTVISDAPITAERRAHGRIWVNQPVRVLGTEMFRGDTQTLPVETFTSGIEIPEDEIVGIRLYDLGGEVVYRPALFLIQLSNETDTTVLTKIAEVAGIAATLGTGALGGLGVEATMAARVLLWADRAAFAIGTAASAIREHRGDIIARYGESGRQFVRYVDLVHSATAIYGFARVAIAMGQLVHGLRTSYVNFRAAARGAESELTAGQRQAVATVNQHVDVTLQQADEINAAAQSSGRGGRQAQQGSQQAQSSGGAAEVAEGVTDSPGSQAAATVAADERPTLPPPGRAAPRIGERLVDRSTPARYHVSDAGNERLSAFATVEEGEILITLRAQLPDGTRSPLLRGAEQFQRILAHFSGRFRGIRGSWSYGDNLEAFNNAIRAGRTLEAAALETWTGQQAAAAGYTHVIIRSTEGAPGNFQRALVVFERAR